MSDISDGNWLDREVSATSDHILGPPDADITLVEYGSYACPYCRAANERIAEVRDQFGVISHAGQPSWSSSRTTPSGSGTRTSS